MKTLTNYFLPTLLGYGIPCLMWYLIYRFKPIFWPTSTIERPEKPSKDLLFGLLAGVGIIGIGQLWRAGLLVPNVTENRTIQLGVWWINNLIIYSPIFLVIFLRKQGLRTVFISTKGIVIKLGFGLLATLVGLMTYMIFSGGSVIEILIAGFRYENYKNFLPVFLEGIALAFLFVRLKWTVGLKWALAIPAILFSLSHIPRALADDAALSMIIMDSVLTALVTLIVFSATAKSRDIIWLGILHYFMDIAIGAFF